MSTDITVFQQIATAVVQGQMGIMGKVAVSLASRVDGVSVDDAGLVTIIGDGQQAISALVEEYSTITGPLGIRMCHAAAKSVLEANPSVTIVAFVAAGIL